MVDYANLSLHVCPQSEQKAEEALRINRRLLRRAQDDAINAEAIADK